MLEARPEFPQRFGSIPRSPHRVGLGRNHVCLVVIALERFPARNGIQRKRPTVPTVRVFPRLSHRVVRLRSPGKIAKRAILLVRHYSFPSLKAGPDIRRVPLAGARYFSVGCYPLQRRTSTAQTRLPQRKTLKFGTPRFLYVSSGNTACFGMQERRSIDTVSPPSHPANE